MLQNIKPMNYEEYLDTADEEELIVINKLYEQGQLVEKGLKHIINIKESVNILVITSTKCKDSATIVPFLTKLAQFNEKIKIKFLLKKDYEQLLEELSGENKVPTFMVIDSKGKVLRKFVEFPKEVKEILISNSKDNTQEIIDNMRKGVYNNLIQQDLIKFITGKDYDYISFKRLDK